MFEVAIEREHKKALKIGKQEGLALGITRGKQEGKQEIARKMLAKGLDINLISSLTGLSRTAIAALKLTSPHA